MDSYEEKKSTGWLHKPRCAGLMMFNTKLFRGFETSDEGYIDPLWPCLWKKPGCVLVPVFMSLWIKLAGDKKNNLVHGDLPVSQETLHYVDPRLSVGCEGSG